jgi:hypothetical protein
MVAKACECQIEIEHNGTLRKDTVSSNASAVKAASLRQQMLHFFKVGRPIDDFEPESDEDESWTLLGFGADGQNKELDGADIVNLSDYRTFRLTPRTAGGLPENG